MKHMSLERTEAGCLPLSGRAAQGKHRDGKTSRGRRCTRGIKIASSSRDRRRQNERRVRGCCAPHYAPEWARGSFVPTDLAASTAILRLRIRLSLSKVSYQIFWIWRPLGPVLQRSDTLCSSLPPQICEHLRCRETTRL